MTEKLGQVVVAAIIPYQELLGNYDQRYKPYRGDLIIPYQELLGNYDTTPTAQSCTSIIPYQELLGNYDCWTSRNRCPCIIPYQELLGNYDHHAGWQRACKDYTIPRAIRELWFSDNRQCTPMHYTISAQYAQNLPQIFPEGLATACGFCYNLGLLSNLGF